MSEPDAAPRPSLFRRMVRWIPVALLLVAGLGAWLLVVRGGLLGVTAWYLLLAVVPGLGLLFLGVVLAYGLWKQRFSRVMLVTTLVSVLALVPALWLLGLWKITYPVSLVNAVPAATVRLPADAPLQVAWGGDSVETNYHASTPDQRWAYDLVVAPYFTGSDSLDAYGCYGIPVLAPTAGRVAVAHDGEPEATPGRLSMNIENPMGNYVAIELPEETYLILAHLQTGSVSVEEGEQVVEGQVLGLCGNSGNTSEPHIHIHHQRQNPADFPVNFAEGLPLYFRDHDGQPMPEGGLLIEDGKIMATGDTVQHRGTQ